VARIAAEVPQRFETLVKQLAVAPIPAREDLVASYCVSIVVSLVDRDLLRQKKDFLGALQRMDQATDPDRFAQLQRALMGIENERRALRDS
jgi:DNA primase